MQLVRHILRGVWVVWLVCVVRLLATHSWEWALGAGAAFLVLVL